MTEASQGSDPLWSAVIERFEKYAPTSLMARTALEHALPAGWVDEVFDQHRQWQYTRELFFSAVVRLMMLVALGLRSSLHAAAREAEDLTVSLPALYDKVNRTEPALLRALVRALVRGSAARLAPVMTAAGTGHPSLPGYALRVLDGNHLPGSDIRSATPLQGTRSPRGSTPLPHWRSLNAFRQDVRRIWFKSLQPCSQKNRRMAWDWFDEMTARLPLPLPRITHPWTPSRA